ncbi:MAG: hypothetical protein MUP68_06595, partial [Deltaproteobacteria bacterium]|nr:hypothetical protein [Deltaproteobacteria bacterium]
MASCNTLLQTVVEEDKRGRPRPDAPTLFGGWVFLYMSYVSFASAAGGKGSQAAASSFACAGVRMPGRTVDTFGLE